ncbi:hypothetical protein AGMMS49521_0200 [Campylobacterota bacterium]|nr:hypothetical protein AGMMS49521_0200 [Campylobacterota bacterium]
MNHIAIIINWFGPYQNIEEAQTVSAKDFSDGLYLAIGRTPYQRGEATLQYVGLASDLASRLNNNHHKLPEIKHDFKLWLGEIASTGIAGRKKKVTEIRLDLAEWCHSYFLELPLNEKKRDNPPDRPVTVLNRWWFKDYERKRIQRPHPDWPDIIEFLGKKYGARISWVGRSVGG